MLLYLVQQLIQLILVKKLGGGFKYLLCSPLFWEDEPILTSIFSKGLTNILKYDDTVDGGNPAPFGMVLKPCKSWDKLPFPQLVRRISEPSTVSVFPSKKGETL